MDDGRQHFTCSLNVPQDVHICTFGPFGPKRGSSDKYGHTRPRSSWRRAPTTTRAGSSSKPRSRSGSARASLARSHERTGEIPGAWEAISSDGSPERQTGNRADDWRPASTRSQRCATPDARWQKSRFRRVGRTPPRGHPPGGRGKVHPNTKGIRAGGTSPSRAGWSKQAHRTKKSNARSKRAGSTRKRSARTIRAHRTGRESPYQGTAPIGVEIHGKGSATGESAPRLQRGCEPSGRARFCPLGDRCADTRASCGRLPEMLAFTCIRKTVRYNSP